MININAKNPKFVSIMLAAFLLASSVSYAAVQAQDANQNGKTAPEYMRTGDVNAAAKNDIVSGKYIVELSQKPLAVRAKELKSSVGTSAAAGIAQQKNAIEAEHQSVKNAITGTLGSLGMASASAMGAGETANKPVISAEFQNVFDGMTVSNINDMQAEQIKSFSGVKNVYPVRKVHSLISDSVPLIGADQVWKMDKDGNNCAQSGKECLTGKGMKIAVIDTGVDYTHADLGNSSQELQVKSVKITSNKLDFEKTGVLGYSFDGLKMSNSRAAYLSGCEIHLYNLTINSETIIEPPLCPDSLEFDGNYIAYKGSEYDRNSGVFHSTYLLYIYDISTGEHRKIRDLTDGYLAAKMELENGHLFYGYSNGSKDTSQGSNSSDLYPFSLYFYDAKTGNEKVIDNGSIADINAYGGLAVYAKFGDKFLAEIANLKYGIYNISSGELKYFKLPGSMHLLDFNGNKLLYLTTNTGPLGEYRLYDISSGNYEPIYLNQGSVLQSAKAQGGITIYYNGLEGGLLESGLVYMTSSTPSFASLRSIYVHDISLNKTVKIIGDMKHFDAEGNKICFSYRNLNIYCHDYDPKGNYSTIIVFNSKVIGGYDFISNDDDPMDDMGHGTHVAATAAGNGTLKGVAPDAKILAYKVLDSTGSGDSDTIIAGIERAVDPNNDADFSDRADVISMSLGGPGDPDDPLSSAIDNAVDAGVISVIAGGNWGPGMHTIASPGTARKAITVAASDKNDAIADFSSRGPVIWTDTNGKTQYLYKPDIAAPGVSICAAQSSQDQMWGWYNADGVDIHCKDDKHIAISGTSMATPHVAGLAALLKQKCPDASPEKIKLMIIGSSKKISDNSLESGYGRINATGAVSVAFASPDNISSIENAETSGDYYSIKGKINPQGFEKYKVEIAHINPEGGAIVFREVGTSSSLPTDGYLGKNIPLPEDYGLHLLKLTVFAGQKQTARFAFLFNRKGKFISLMDGWPKKAADFQAGFFGIGTTPIIYDLDNDGKQEIIVTANDLVTAFRTDGTLMNGWPKKLDHGTMSSGSIPPPSVGDINGDGKPEIIYFNYWSFFTKNGKACGYAWGPDGSNAPGWENQCPADLFGSNTANQTRSLSMLYDLDKDGKDEIINWVNYWEENVQNQKFFINVVKGDGSIADGWPLVFDAADDKTQRAITFPAVGDLDGDGIPEIVTLENDYDNDPKSFACAGNILTYTPKGELKKKFSSQCNYGYYEGIILLDVDGDGKLEIGYHTKDEGIVFYDANGNAAKNWPFNNYGFQKYLLSVADLAGDGTPDIIFPVWSRDSPHTFDGVNAIDSSAKQLPGWPKKTIGFPLWVAPQAADINDDNKSDVMTTTSAGLVYAWNGNGTAVSGFPIEMPGASQSGTAIGEIYVWKLTSKQGKTEWPMWKHDAQNTALYSKKSSAACTDTDGGKNYFAKGTTMNSTFTGIDQCYDDTKGSGITGNKVHEYYCSGNYVLRDEYACSNGCYDGACTGNTFTLQLKKGWNLFSVPVKENQPTPFTSLKTDCQYKSPLWRYSNAKNSYEKATAVTGSKESFWIKAGADCSVAVKNDGAYEMDEYFGNFALKKGWNFIGAAPEQIGFAKINGTCTFTKGPYSFNTAANKWEKQAETGPGNGYVVAVQNDCALKFEEETPPPFPEFAATGAATAGTSEDAPLAKLAGVSNMIMGWLGQS